MPKHKRDSVVSRGSFCLVNRDFELERPLKSIGLLTLGDRDNVVAGRSWIDVISIMAIGGHVLFVGRSRRGLDADGDVHVVTQRFEGLFHVELAALNGERSLVPDALLSLGELSRLAATQGDNDLLRDAVQRQIARYVEAAVDLFHLRALERHVRELS